MPNAFVLFDANNRIQIKKKLKFLKKYGSVSIEYHFENLKYIFRNILFIFKQIKWIFWTENLKLP